MSNVELLRELVEDRPVAVLVLLDDGGDEGDKAVPELQVVVPRASLLHRAAVLLVLAGLLCVQCSIVKPRYYSESRHNDN